MSIKIKNWLLKKVDKSRKTTNPLLRILIKLRDKIGIYRIKHRTGKKHLLTKYNAIYFKIPKVANTSLRSTFRKVTDLKLLPYKRSLNEKEYDRFFKFSFVRNPFDRLVSCYAEKIIGHKTPYGENQIDATFFRYNKFYSDMPFEEFVKAVCSIPDEIADFHFRSQYKSLTNKQGKFIVDFIGRFENLKEDYKKVFRILGVKNPPKLEHRRKSKRKHYREYYNEETKNLIKKRYKKDLEFFGYTF